MTGRDGFGQVLRGEWTKFWTVRSTILCVVATIGLTLLLSLFAASSSGTNANDNPRFSDRFHFVHQPLDGDGTVIARVASQQRSHEWAKAGLMIKDGTTHGSRYAAVMLTPDHGVRLQATFGTDVAGTADGAPRWLRLSRTGSSITGYSSADGNSWNTIGSLEVALPRVAEVGMFVTSPYEIRTVKTGAGAESGFYPTTAVAIFDNVDVAGSTSSATWTGLDIADPEYPDLADPGTDAERAGAFRLTGSGDVSGYGIPGWQGAGDDDTVRLALTGVQIGLMAVIALGVLFVTSEYKTSTIRTTFTASPRRGRVLVAKAILLGGTVFLAGLVASVAAFLITQPILRSNGFAPPAYLTPSLMDGPVLRAVIGTALFLAVLAVFSLGVGAVRRRTVGAIIIVIALVVVPQMVQPVMSLNVGLWLERLTPVAGLAIQQTRPQFDAAIDPWAGFAVLCAYAAAAMVLAFWQLRRRDA